MAEPGARGGGARVRFERQGAVGHVVLEHPPLNLFGAEVLDDLETAVEEAGRAEIRALVVRAEGKVFTGGVDVNMFDGLSPQDARARPAPLPSQPRGRGPSVPHPRLRPRPLPHRRLRARARLRFDLGRKSARFGLVEIVVGVSPFMDGTSAWPSAPARPGRASW